MKDLFQLLTPDEAVDLCGFDPIVLEPDVTATDGTAWQQSFLEYLAGTRSIETELRRALESGQERKALFLGARAYHAKVPLPADIEASLQGCWARLREYDSASRTSIIASLDQLDPRDRDASEYRTLLLADLSQLEPLSAQPSSTAEVVSAFETRASVEKLREDCAAIAADYLEETAERRRRLAEIGQRAFARTLARYQTDQTHTVGAVLRMIPELIVKGDIDTLSRVAEGNLSERDATVLADVHAPIKSGRTASRIRRRPQGSPVPRSIELSGLSARLVEQAEAREQGVDSAEDLRRYERSLGLGVAHGEIGQIWLGLAKATRNDNPGYWAALGRGLVAWGREYLEADRLRLAGDLLRDGVTALAQTSQELAGRSLEEAVHLLVVSRAWPAYASSASADLSRFRIEQWLSDFSLPLRWVAQSHNLQLLALLWAELDSTEAAERFLELTSRHIGLMDELVRECASEAATAYRLRLRPRLTLEQLKQFYVNAGASDELVETLDKVGQLLDHVGRKRVSGDLARELSSYTEFMRRTFGSWPGLELGPLGDASARLPGLLDGLLQLNAASVRAPHLTVQPLIVTLYPTERSEEVQIPILVRNHDDSVPIPDVSLQVDVDAASRPFVRFQREAIDGHAIGLMEPGAEEHVNFVVDLADNIVGRLAEIKLDVLVRSEKLSLSEAGRKRHTIIIKPGSRETRRNPYPTGLAVEPEHFIGREKEVKQVCDAVMGLTRDSTPAVVGIRRIGKTSLLKKIQAEPEIERRFYPVYVSVEDRPDNDTSVQLLIYLAAKIRDSLPTEHKHKVPFYRDEFRADPFAAFEAFTDGLTALRLSRGVLLIIDEFDRILDLIHKPRTSAVDDGHRVDPQVLGALRKALMKNGAIRLVLAGLPTILHAQYEDRLFGLLLPVHVEPFTDRDGDRVIEASNGILALTTGAREHLFRETGLQPYLLNLTCHYLFVQAQGSGRDQVTLTDVQHVIQSRILNNENCFLDYMKLVGDDSPVLRAVAAADRKARHSRQWIATADIARELQRSGEFVDIDHLKVTLRSLTDLERPLLRALGVDRYQPVIGMLGNYLLQRQVI